ncbi:MAG: hypothetical protein HY720_05400 [Planctomycetes bacterium]|nr:hypothetical protein [Planctomycetota bacterium]
MNRTVSLALAVVVAAIAGRNAGAQEAGDAADPNGAIVDRWLAGASLEAEVRALGRKALPALAVRSDRPQADGMAKEIRARPLRVLVVETHARWEYRILRSPLLADRELLVQVLLYSAGLGFAQEHTPDASDPEFKEGLGEFPAKLASRFDVVLLGEVSPEGLDAEGLVSFVREFGGGPLARWTARLDGHMAIGLVCLYECDAAGDRKPPFGSSREGLRGDRQGDHRDPRSGPRARSSFQRRGEGAPSAREAPSPDRPGRLP